MPTSSQSKILSVIDYQLAQQQTGGHDDVTKTVASQSGGGRTSANESKRYQNKDGRRGSFENKRDQDNRSPSPLRIVNRRFSSEKNADAKLRKRQSCKRCLTHQQHNKHSCHRPGYRGIPSGTASQRSDVLHVPVINLNDMAHNQPRPSSIFTNVNGNRQQRTKSTLLDATTQLQSYRRNSFNSDNDDPNESEYKAKSSKRYPSPRSNEDRMSSGSESDRRDDAANEDDDRNETNHEDKPGLLNENARRLLILGTIRPSKTFYKNLSDADVDHLMDYFRRMKNTHQNMTAQQIHEEITAKFVEYKPKIFFDSTTVTKSQVTQIEKLVEEYADHIKSRRAEFVKLDNPMRFVIKQVDDGKALITIPREYNDCFITLVTRSDPLRKSDLLSELVQEKLLTDVKANSLDISYFPGGVNYDVPRDEIDENGQMNTETYEKLKKRLNNRKVWHFSGPPEKKPNAILAILPPEASLNIDHRRLLDALYERLKTSSTKENCNVDEQILSIEFVPLNCILNASDASNQFIVDCDTSETKQKLMEKPLKIALNKQSIVIELQSYDENMHKEYEKFVKSEKYRELIKNHDAAVKRVTKK